MSDNYTYARFWRCALQVNTSKYSGTYRGTDHGLSEDEYNDALLAQCRELNIKVIGIADHNSVESIDRLREHLVPHGIVVFPGFEIASTEKIHMVCLFPEKTNKDTLNRYLGTLGLTDVEQGVRPSSLGCIELAKKIQDLDGFWYAAHATGSSGVLRLNKDGGGLAHVWRDSDCVRVAQIPGSARDLLDNYGKIIRNENPDYKRERPIVLINAKDIAKPEDLADPSATCWIKMTRPGFEAFKVAFLDPESRVRLHSDLKPTPHGTLRSIAINGGYLDGLRVDLSEHLNTVIGGRGTGKSTLIECLRYALEVTPKGKQAQRLHQDIIKENLGKSSGSVELSLVSAAQYGGTFTVIRRYGEPPIVRDATGNVSQLQPRDLLPTIEFYGQNEIYELAQDPQSRGQILDRFLPNDASADRQRSLIRKRLDDNRQKLIKALTDLDEAEEQLARLPKLTEQLKGFQALGIETRLAKSPLFAREKQMVARARQEVARLDEGLATLQESLPDLAFLTDKALDGLPNATHFVSLRQSLEGLRAAAEQHLAELRQASVQGRSALEALISAWQTALTAGEEEIERALATVPDMAGKSGRDVGTAYKTLTQEIERIKPLEARFSTLRQLRAALEQERANLLAELSDLRAARAAGLAQAVQKLNKRLAGKLQVELRPEGERSPIKAFLVASRLDGVGEKRLAWVEEQDELTPLGLVKAIREGQARLKSEYGLTPGVADALTRLPRDRLFELEELELSDHVEVTLNVAHDQGQPSFKPLRSLSTGQQCTAVLHLLLLDNPDPLIIDQPEDNLDNAFIAERIVRELRRVKTQRQFFFSTHNANIPVFGDAEWIGIVTASDNQGALSKEQQGSIDVPSIREQVADILEGGREAFMLRKAKYDF